MGIFSRKEKDILNAINLKELNDNFRKRLNELEEKVDLMSCKPLFEVGDEVDGKIIMSVDKKRYCHWGIKNTVVDVSYSCYDKDNKQVMTMSEYELSELQSHDNS